MAKKKKHPEMVNASIINGNVCPTNAPASHAINAQIEIPLAGNKEAISIHDIDPNDIL